MITRIKVKNWRSHLESELEFSKGTNALLGHLGSGKSSIMNAVCFGLFGTFPDLQSRKIKLDDIIMNKPSIKDKSQITVDFKVDGKKYSVMRVIERNKGTTYSEIREDSKLLEAPNTQRVTELVENILKIDYELFSRAIYSEQNSLDYFLALPRGERMKKIDNLLMIDRFENTRSGAVTLQNRLTERKIEKEKLIKQIDEKKVEKSLKDIDYSLNKLEETKNRLSDELKEKESAKKDLEIEIKNLESANQRLNSFKQEKKTIEGGIKENKDLIKTVEKIVKDRKISDVEKELERSKKELQDLQDRLRNKRSEYEKLLKTISHTETSIRFLEKEVEKTKTEIDEKIKIREKLVDIQKEYGENPSEVLEKEKNELESIKKSITSLSAKIDEIKETLDKIVKLEKRCPVCESSITKERKEELIETYNHRMDEINKKLENLKKENEIKKGKVSELENVVDNFKKYSLEIRNLETLQKRVENAVKSHLSLNKELAEKRKELEKIKDVVTKLEENVEESKRRIKNLESTVEKLSELEEKKSRLNKLISSKEEIDRKITELSRQIEGKNLEEIRKRFNEALSRYSELISRIKSLDELIEEKNERKKEQEEKLKLIETEKRDVLYLEKIINDLNIFEKALKQTQTQLRENFIETVNYTMNEIWPDLYPYDDFIDARLSIKDRDYVLQLQERTERWVDVEGIVSGGERSIACLVLRIAFSLALAPQLRIMILDEPTANLDKKSISVLASTLRDRIGDIIDQTFLITHQTELEESVTGNMYFFERDKSLDEPTRIRT